MDSNPDPLHPHTNHLCTNSGWFVGSDSSVSFPSPFCAWKTLIYPTKPSSNVPFLESLFWQQSSGPPETSACIPGTKGVSVDNFSPHPQRNGAGIFFLASSFLPTKCFAWAFTLVSCGAPQGPWAPDSSFPGAAKLHHFQSADASHLPGILPAPILAWCPLRERNSCLLSLQWARPWAGSSCPLAHLILYTSL